MYTVRNFAEAHAALETFYTNHRLPYTLDTIRTLLAHVGNPQDKLKVLHVAGTSGKTSTAYYLAGLLEEAGLKTGLTVSPHVDEVNERVQINLEPLPEGQFCEALGDFLGLVAASGTEPSYFEVLVAFAYWYFAREQVDVAVIEVGLGGLLDGTNVVLRADKLCVITDIGYDHTQILGDTLDKIAAQKAGIIQPGNDVWMHSQGRDVMQVMEVTCERQQAILHVVPPAVEEVASEELPLFQQRNFRLAHMAAEFWLRREGREPLSDTQLAEAAHTYIPARMEIITLGGKTLVIDGAHNAQKLGTLAKSISARFPETPIAILAAFVAGDPDRAHGALQSLARLGARIIVTEFQSSQDAPKESIPAQQAADYLKEQGGREISVEPDPAAAYRSLISSPEPLLLVTGSFYLLNHIRPLILKAA